MAFPIVRTEMSSHLEIGSLVAEAGISVPEHVLRIEATRAGFTVLPNQRGELHVPIDQAERFKAWIKTFPLANPTRARTRP